MGITRKKVQDLLSSSAAFKSLPVDKQQAIFRDTLDVASYLTQPEGVRADQLSTKDPYALSLADDNLQFRTGTGVRPGENDQEFRAQAAREGASVAGALLNQVNFVHFVSGLIDGVFNSIVDSSIKQMEAYGELVSNVAKSLNQFRDENVTANQARDHLVDQFPDLFEISVDTGDDFFGSSFGEESSGPRVKLRNNVDGKQAAEKVNARGYTNNGQPFEKVDNEIIEQKLVLEARNELARSRQQLLATMVMMGINRIVVTDGKIQAKVLYDFQAQDRYQFRKSATEFDYGDQYVTTREGSYESDRQGSSYDSSYSKDEGWRSQKVGGRRWAKGEYKTKQTPVLKLASATQEAAEGALQTRASLAGVVEVNFKSDFLPLDKIADNFQIAMIQAASKPSEQGGRGVNNQNQEDNQADKNSSTSAPPSA